jgi:hypothetical protein
MNVGEITARFRDAVSRLLASEDGSASVRASIDRLEREVSRLVETADARSERLVQILQVTYDREPEMRERVAALRGSAAYEAAFEQDTPLVSVVIPTYDRGELLVERAVPSVLAQTYENVEIVVVGDAAPQSTEEWLRDLKDPRITYRNLTLRGPYPEDARDRWHVAGVPARNAAVALARGAWIAPLDDDDAFHPEHVEQLLDLARQERSEVAYGVMRCVMNDGTEFPLGAFPPRYGQFGWQSAVFHAGLRFFEMELADALFGSPADWSLCRRMMRAGVRFAMTDAVLADHYESRFRPGAAPPE